MGNAQRGYSSGTAQCFSDFSKTEFYYSRVKDFGKIREKRRQGWMEEVEETPGETDGEKRG